VLQIEELLMVLVSRTNEFTTSEHRCRWATCNNNYLVSDVVPIVARNNKNTLYPLVAL